VTRDVRSAPEGGRRLLTPRELDVLRWIARGKTAGEIATILGIGKRTVDEHAASAVGKLGAANRTHAVVLAIQQEIITSDGAF
jgi:DNA-binding CsgD family transcriptional regulator